MDQCTTHKEAEDQKHEAMHLHPTPKASPEHQEITFTQLQ